MDSTLTPVSKVSPRSGGVLLEILESEGVNISSATRAQPSAADLSEAPAIFGATGGSAEAMTDSYAQATPGSSASIIPPAISAGIASGKANLLEIIICA